MKICVVTPRFAIAGVPLAQVRFARAWAAAGHQVDLIIGFVVPGTVMPDTNGINLVVLDRPKVRDMVWPLRNYLKQQRPDIVFSAEDHLNTLVLVAALLARSKAKISGSSRVTPFDTYSNVPFSKRWILKQLARLVAPRADALTCVSEDMVLQYREVFRNPRHVCVYNIVADRQARDRMAEPVEDPWFGTRDAPLLVGAGSLAPWKGFADLIDAAVILRDRGRMVRLAILGEGELRPALEAQIARLGLGDRVRLVGHVANPLKYFARADVFVLSSHVEGLPNVLVEAMLCGCTPVATDCPTGPREVLQDGRFGYLVAPRDPAAIAAGIERAIERPIAPALLAEAVVPFEERRVLERHLRILGLEPA